MRQKLKWLLPILLIALFAPFSPYLDKKLSSLFYDPNTNLFYNPLLFRFLYKYGELFTCGIGALCGFLFCLSFIKSSLIKYRITCLSFGLTLVIGAGLFTNVLFKGYWGRPRPKQVVEFGGKHEFRPFYKPHFNPPEAQKSFPSGHVAMGFCYLALCFAFRRNNQPLLYYIALILCIFFGCGLMVARVAQGGHFLSDVLFSFAFIWTVALAMDYFCEVSFAKNARTCTKKFLSL